MTSRCSPAWCFWSPWCSWRAESTCAWCCSPPVSCWRRWPPSRGSSSTRSCATVGDEKIVGPICSAMGFAWVLRVSGSDRELARLLIRPIRARQMAARARRLRGRLRHQHGDHQPDRVGRGGGSDPGADHAGGRLASDHGRGDARARLLGGRQSLQPGRSGHRHRAERDRRAAGPACSSGCSCRSWSGS